MVDQAVMTATSLLDGEDRPLTVREAARYLGLSPSQIYKLTHKHKIPFYKPGGKKIYFKKRDLVAYAFQNRVDSQEEVDEKAIAKMSENRTPGRRVA